jgi:hypothetical protein
MTTKEQAIQELKGMGVTPHSTVYTILRYCAPSGGLRRISFVIMQDGKPVNIDYWVSIICGLKRPPSTQGLIIHGSGTDMGFATVYNLSSHMYPDGFGVRMRDTIADKPSDIVLVPTPDYYPSSKHAASVAHSQGYKGIGRNGDTSGWDNDGGYALKQEWL